MRTTRQFRASVIAGAFALIAGPTFAQDAESPSTAAPSSVEQPRHTPAADQGTTSEPPGETSSTEAEDLNPSIESQAAGDDAARGATEARIPLLQFQEPARWAKVELLDHVTGGCFLSAGEAEGYAARQIEETGFGTEGDEDVFHVVFRIRATGGRTTDGECFGAVFFEELYPVDLSVKPGAEAYRSRWHGRLGLQKLVLQEDAFDREVFAVIDDAVRILFRER